MITFKAKTPSGEIIKSAISDFIFPAGEAHLKVEPRRDIESTEIAIIQPSADSLHDDLFKLAMWNDYVERSHRGVPGNKRILVIPYFPAARADRISPNVEEPFGLGVYVDFISRLQLDQIIIFDPHSDVTEHLLTDDGNNVTVVKSAELFAQPEINEYMYTIYDGIIAPDKGATQRATEVADVLGLPVYTAEKTRDPETGKLSGFKIDGLPESHSSTVDGYKAFLIVDDICDRGGTFVGLFNATGREWGGIDLFVSHGVFSSDALENLSGAFESVYTTNSYNPKRHLEAGPEDYTEFRRYDIIHLMLDKVL